MRQACPGLGTWPQTPPARPLYPPALLQRGSSHYHRVAGADTGWESGRDLPKALQLGRGQTQDSSPCLAAPKPVFSQGAGSGVEGGSLCPHLVGPGLKETPGVALKGRRVQGQMGGPVSGLAGV